MATKKTTAVKKTPATPTAPSAPRWRRSLVAVLLVIGCVLAPLSVVAVWTRNTLLSTDQYVDTVAPLAENQAITDRVAARAVEALFKNVDVDAEVRSVLPEKAAIIAPAVTQAIRQLASEVAHRFVESQQFRTLWRELNRRAHTQVRAVLTGEGRATLGGKVVVNLGPVVETVRTRLEGLDLNIFPDAGGKRISDGLVLFEAETLEQVQGGVDLLQTLAVVLPILAVLLLAAGVFLSSNRRRSLLRVALGIALAMALLLLAYNLARSVYLDAFRPVGRAAGEAAYDQILSFLRISVRALFALALVVAMGAWIAGPGRVATGIRALARRLIGGAAGQVDATGVDLSGAGQVVARNRTPLRGGVVGAGALLLMVLSRPTGATVLVIAILVLIGLGLIEVLARAAVSSSGRGA